MTKTPVRADVAQRLKTARMRLFTTASQAADALDMKAVTLRAHENAQNGVNIYDLERYARRYNVNVQWLLTGQGDLEPDPQLHVELGEMIDVEGTVVPDAWVPNDDPTRVRQKFRRPAVPEMVPFTDPRFPTGLVQAFRVASASPLAHYISGSILFCINSSDTGFNSGDHVLVIRERGDFTNVSVRRALKGPKGMVFESLTDPDEPDLTYDVAKHEEPLHISAVVIGSLTRRPVRTVDLETLKAFEEYERSRHFGPKEWKAATNEAEAVVSGALDPAKAEHFDTVEDAQSWLEATKTTDA